MGFEVRSEPMMMFFRFLRRCFSARMPASHNAIAGHFGWIEAN